jgi:hypothetical protein
LLQPGAGEDHRLGSVELRARPRPQLVQGERRRHELHRVAAAQVLPEPHPRGGDRVDPREPAHQVATDLAEDEIELFEVGDHRGPDPSRWVSGDRRGDRGRLLLFPRRLIDHVAVQPRCTRPASHRKGT